MIRTKAIVLNRFPHKENDALIYFYTLDFGKLVLTARGARKQSSKLVAHLEPFNFVDLMMIKNKNGVSVGSVISQNSFLNLKNDYNSLLLSGKVFSFFNQHVKEGQADFDLFIFLNNFLKTINDSIESVKSKSLKDLDFLGDILKFKLLDLLGYSYQTSRCVECGCDKNLNFISLNRGGVVCDSCTNKETINRSLDKINHLKINKDLLSLKEFVKKNDFSFLLDLKTDKNFQNFIKRKINYLNF
ncbi:MAG: DNA repair protein RecO [Patescibacteria group bacterium]|nr:DNA repair protein RecO [Patescibacteria group bacterium]